MKVGQGVGTGVRATAIENDNSRIDPHAVKKRKDSFEGPHGETVVIVGRWLEDGSEFNHAAADI